MLIVHGDQQKSRESVGVIEPDPGIQGSGETSQEKSEKFIGDPCKIPETIVGNSIKSCET